MATKEARQRAVQKYLEGKDEFRIRVDKGRKAEIQAHADAKGESLNGYVIRAIDERIERDQEGSQPLTGDELDALDKLPLDD